MEDRNYAYRQLAVWQKAMLLVKLVYAQIHFLPPEERFALADQMRRAVTSIPSNIAEGNGRASNRLSIARGSLYEVMTQFEIAQSLGYLEPSAEIESLSTEIRLMLNAMLKRFAPPSHHPPPTSNLKI